MSVTKIPFRIKTSRILDLLAKQIYQSPLALLRENTQNAYDAILMRLQSEEAFSSPRIEVVVASDQIVITDNGIGMTPDEVQNNYWRAGSSGKDTAEARDAGVVGTFGIGAMANFGIAEAITVETESAKTGERCRSRAIVQDLSLNRDCVDMEALQSVGKAGTTVTARLSPGHTQQVQRAQQYLAGFVQLLETKVMFNGVCISGEGMEAIVPRPNVTWDHVERGCSLGPRLTADIHVVVSQNADIWLKLEHLVWLNTPISGSVVLRSNTSALRTYRSRFGLATVSVASPFQFGGAADLRDLVPTAGREALATSSMQFLQLLVQEVDAFVAQILASRPESDASTSFMNWVIAHGRYELCGNLRMSIQPGDRVTLAEVERRSKQEPMLVYSGGDASVAKRFASDDKPLLIHARRAPRRNCELKYLRRFCQTEEIDTSPAVEWEKPMADLTLAEGALLYRMKMILDEDYFLDADIGFGKISHGLPVIAKKVDGRVTVTLDHRGQTASMILSLYDREFTAFRSMTKDFVRNLVFPRISEYVPSSTRQGAEAFLKAISKPREIFEYEDADLSRLPEIWEDYQDGRISMQDAVAQSMAAVQANVQIVDSGATLSVRDVVPDVIENEAVLQSSGGGESSVSLEAAPAISRSAIGTEAKLLTIDTAEPALQGYRCFLAISDHAREMRGEFFLQPHTTSVVWGGQKVLFIFSHHSRNFGLYYDLISRESVLPEASGGPYPTCTILLKNRIYIPIPEPIMATFIPGRGERKRFEVRHDFLRVEDGMDP